jgi:hypothetical protein
MPIKPDGAPKCPVRATRPGWSSAVTPPVRPTGPTNRRSLARLCGLAVAPATPRPHSHRCHGDLSDSVPAVARPAAVTRGDLSHSALRATWFASGDVFSRALHDVSGLFVSGNDQTYTSSPQAERPMASRRAAGAPTPIRPPAGQPPAGQPPRRTPHGPRPTGVDRPAAYPPARAHCHRRRVCSGWPPTLESWSFRPTRCRCGSSESAWPFR